MLKKILTYTLGLWYLVLFQVYPIMHLHWHEQDGLEACFIATNVENGRLTIHRDVQLTGGHTTVHTQAQDLHANEDSHITFHTDCGVDHCHFLHVSADYDHFFPQEKGGDKKLRAADPAHRSAPDQSAPDYNCVYYPHFSFIFADFYYSTPSNKSPPRC